MKSMSTNQPFQLLGDGKQIAIIVPDSGTYLFKNPYIKNFNVYTPPPIEVSSCYDIYKTYVPDRSYIDLTLNIQCSTMEVNDKESNFINNDLINKLSVLDLLKIINKRLNKRK